MHSCCFKTCMLDSCLSFLAARYLNSSSPYPMSDTFFHRFLELETWSCFGPDFESESSNLNKKRTVPTPFSGQVVSSVATITSLRQVAAVLALCMLCTVSVVPAAWCRGVTGPVLLRDFGHLLDFTAFQPGAPVLPTFLCRFFSCSTRPKLSSVACTWEPVFSWHLNGLLLNLLYYHRRQKNNHLVAVSCSEGFFLGHASHYVLVYAQLNTQGGLCRSFSVQVSLL